MIHRSSGWVCIACRYEHGPLRREERRYKKVLRRLDKIGARLAGIR